MTEPDFGRPSRKIESMGSTGCCLEAKEDRDANLMLTLPRVLTNGIYYTRLEYSKITLVCSHTVFHVT